MVKALAWIDRGTEPFSERLGEEIKRDHPRMEGPYVGWRRDLGTHVEICSTFFPGSKPIWYWEEK